MQETGNETHLRKETRTPDTSPKSKPKPRARKRKRIESDSQSESDEGLPENALEVEKNLIASAVKNNLDDVSVKKILKKVVTNDHVLALVKLREEEESNTEKSQLIPKLTRSKVKELTKVSPKSAPWNIQNMELTPIKHIPVKTRPEVKALIAQELPEDEDDEEYEPTHDDVPSDDDQCLESCSDLDSQPRTPATPRGQQRTSPKVVKDGPFKVPQEVSTPTRRRLDLEEEEATIALRTRSKLCLSETPIEHIESSFVPPDELPLPVDDHLWNDFLTECLNPASVSKHEDDDETDPEYNVAADPDAPDDDDEEALEGSIIKISKKELNDLVTELFNIMPEASVEHELANMASGVIAEPAQAQTTPPNWEGKQEPTSDEEGSVKMVDRIVFESRNTITKFSIGKTEPDVAYEDYDQPERAEDGTEPCQEEKGDKAPQLGSSQGRVNVVNIEIEECPETSAAEASRAAGAASVATAPPAVRQLRPAPTTHRLQLLLDQQNVILPEQIQILQQQLRQHVQLAASNFLQLCVHPIHWTLGPTYKEYLESLVKIADSKPKSVVDVCNLRPALELCETWEKTASEDTPENKEMVQFIQAQSDRCQRRMAHNSFYLGEFHETLLRTVANSSVFLYPFLLPAMPYRASTSRRFCYHRSEDSLIALGMDQFWDYVDNNPELYPKPAKPHPNRRWGLTHTLSLVVKHMFPWLSHKILRDHISNLRRNKDKDNPLYNFFETRTVQPVKHKLLPYNPSLTLYEQPEHEMPRIWLRYLAKTSNRFKQFLYRRRSTRNIIAGDAPAGVEIQTGVETALPPKDPLPIDFTKRITVQRLHRPAPKEKHPDRYDVDLRPVENSPDFYKVVETSTGVNLVPIPVVQAIVPVIVNDTNTVTCNLTPISSAVEAKKPEAAVIEMFDASDHCKCCILLRSICKRQKVITDFFKSSRRKTEPCRCRENRGPRISNRLRILVDGYKLKVKCIYRDLMKRLDSMGDERRNVDFDGDCDRRNAEDLAIATAYQIKLTVRSTVASNLYIKKRIHDLFSKFDPDSDDPILLAHQLESSLKVDMVDMHREFLGFLTAEQADQIGMFREYFTLNCVEGLAKKVEEEVKDKAVRHEILDQLRQFFGGSWEACAMCELLLRSMRGLPRLAEYTFHLFPHRSREKTNTVIHQKSPSPEPGQEALDQEQADDTLTNGDTITAKDYEADHSSSGEEENDTESMPMIATQLVQTDIIKMEIEHTLDSTADMTLTTVCKTEPSDDSSDMSMMIMSEDEIIKTEPPEWKREEDKLILEHLVTLDLGPEERKGKTILEILEQKEVLKTLSQHMLNKSIEALKERILYLLNVVLAGKT